MLLRVSILISIEQGFSKKDKLEVVIMGDYEAGRLTDPKDREPINSHIKRKEMWLC
jgi:hypothetical protein